MLDLLFILTAGAVVFLVLAFVVTRANDAALRRHISGRGTRSYDGGRVDVVKLKDHLSLLPYVDAEPEPAALVPYSDPAPAPVIRVNLPQAEPDPAWTAERRTPSRTPSMTTDFAVPAAQAAFTALCVGGMTALLAWALEWSWRVPVAALGLALGLAWLWRLGLVDGLLWQVESLTRHDLTGDGKIGAPLPARALTLANPQAARSEVAAETRQAAEDAQRAALVAFLDTCFLKGTSESAQGIAAGDRADYLTHRDTLLALGIGAWKNPARPRAGWQIVVSHERARQIIARHVL